MTAAIRRSRIRKQDDHRGGHGIRPPHERTLLRVCGLAAVRALFETDSGRVERLFFESGLRAEARGFCAALRSVRKPYREVEASELARIAGTVLHGGIAAIARPRPLGNFDPAAVPGWARDGKPLLVLDGVGNPHNLGAIARTAAFFGIERIVLADRPDQALPSDASYRIAEGGLDHLTLYQAPLPGALANLRPAYHVIGTTLGEGSILRGRHAGKPIALILGNEEKGLAPAMVAACDEIVTIQGSGRVQSLNVAAAAAILIYLANRL
jgi:RNA methyltransferase, TrmH family